MKLAPGHIVEGVVTGLIVAAIGSIAVLAWRRFQTVKFAPADAPEVIDTAGGVTTIFDPQ
jgi:hypothetical protein